MLTTKRTSRTNCSFQISAAVITVTHSQASDVLVGTQKHEDLWVWGWVTVVDTMPCFRDSKKKKVIDLSSLRTLRRLVAEQRPSGCGGDTNTQPCSGGHAAAQEWKHRCFSVQTGRERGGAEADSLVRAPLSVRLFTQLVKFLQPANLQMCFNPRICDYKQLLCGPALLLLLHKQMINPVLTNVRLAANQLSHCSTKDVSGCWRHWAVQRNSHAPLIQSIFAGIITLWMWIMTAGVVTWQK